MVVAHQKGGDTRETSLVISACPAQRDSVRPSDSFIGQRWVPGDHDNNAGSECRGGDEERGQVEAIASSIGGDVLVTGSNRLVVTERPKRRRPCDRRGGIEYLCFEHGTYSVASPEAPAAILRRNAAKAAKARGDAHYGAGYAGVRHY